MFSSSVRRVASTAPSIPVSSSLATSVGRATAAQALSYRSHQRRYSSSKPSSPADGSKRVTQGVHAAPSQARAEGNKKGSRASRKKTKVGVSDSAEDEIIQNLPSVPSTQHIAPLHISASDFFSLHRPISLTNSFPVPITNDAFAAIFTPRTTRKSKPTDVMVTLSRTINNIDAVTGKMKNLKVNTQEDQDNEDVDELRSAILAHTNQNSETQHLDSVPERPSMMFPRHILSGKYMAFNPPPAPVPMNTVDSLAAGAEAAEQGKESQLRTYTTTLTINESTDENGDVTYITHSGPLIAEQPYPPADGSFLQRMRIRQERYWMQQAAEEENGMYAISVKRQRKLKMKKHKYKKLMRRTRNLRRRLDRN